MGHPMFRICLVVALGLAAEVRAQGVPANFTGFVSAEVPYAASVPDEDPPPVVWSVPLDLGTLGVYDGDYSRSAVTPNGVRTRTTTVRAAAFGGPQPQATVDVASQISGPLDTPFLERGDDAFGQVFLDYEVGLAEIAPPPVPFVPFGPAPEFFVDAAAELRYAGGTCCPQTLQASVWVSNPHVHRRFSRRIDLWASTDAGEVHLSEAQRWSGLRMLPGDIVRVHLVARAVAQTQLGGPNYPTVPQSEAFAIADPAFSFNQAAFDAAMADAGFPSYPLHEYFRIVVSPGLAEAVPILFKNGFEP